MKYRVYFNKENGLLKMRNITIFDAQLDCYDFDLYDEALVFMIRNYRFDGNIKYESKITEKIECYNHDAIKKGRFYYINHSYTYNPKNMLITDRNICMPITSKDRYNSFIEYSPFDFVLPLDIKLVTNPIIQEVVDMYEESFMGLDLEIKRLYKECEIDFRENQRIKDYINDEKYKSQLRAYDHFLAYGTEDPRLLASPRRENAI